MSKIASAVLAAVAAVAARPDIPLSTNQVAPVAAAITDALPPPAALESLWPQLARYAISAAGTAFAARGIGDVSDWQTLAAAVHDNWQAIGGVGVAIAPVVWRIATTLLARRPA